MWVFLSDWISERNPLHRFHANDRVRNGSRLCMRKVSDMFTRISNDRSKCFVSSSWDDSSKNKYANIVHSVIWSVRLHNYSINGTHLQLDSVYASVTIIMEVEFRKKCRRRIALNETWADGHLSVKRKRLDHLRNQSEAKSISLILSFFLYHLKNSYPYEIYGHSGQLGHANGMIVVQFHWLNCDFRFLLFLCHRTISVASSESSRRNRTEERLLHQPSKRCHPLQSSHVTQTHTNTIEFIRFLRKIYYTTESCNALLQAMSHLDL